MNSAQHDSSRLGITKIDTKIYGTDREDSDNDFGQQESMLPDEIEAKKLISPK